MDSKLVTLSTLLQQIVELGSELKEQHQKMLDELCASIVTVFADNDHVPIISVEAQTEDGESEIAPGVFLVRTGDEVTIVKK